VKAEVDSLVLIVWWSMQPIFSSSKSKHNLFFWISCFGVWLYFLVDVNLMIFSWSLIGYYSRFWVDVNLIISSSFDENFFEEDGWQFDDFWFVWWKKLDFLEKNVLNSWIFWVWRWWRRWNVEDDEEHLKGEGRRWGIWFFFFFLFFIF